MRGGAPAEEGEGPAESPDDGDPAVARCVTLRKPRFEILPIIEIPKRLEQDHVEAGGCKASHQVGTRVRAAPADVEEDLSNWTAGRQQIDATIGGGSDHYGRRIGSDRLQSLADMPVGDLWSIGAQDDDRPGTDERRLGHGVAQPAAEGRSFLRQSREIDRKLGIRRTGDDRATARAQGRVDGALQAPSSQIQLVGFESARKKRASRTLASGTQREDQRAGSPAGGSMSWSGCLHDGCPASSDQFRRSLSSETGLAIPRSTPRRRS